MQIWSAEIKELEALNTSIKGRVPGSDIHQDDMTFQVPNLVLYCNLHHF
jgi:hypothetical protein